MRPVSDDATGVEVVISGTVPDPVADHARAEIVKLAERLSEPVLRARVRFTGQAVPEGAVLAQVNLDVNGRRVRAQVGGADSREAVDLAVSRLRDRLERRSRYWEARRGGGPPAEGEWRHGSEPTHHPPFFPRPVAEREVVRHKSFSPPRIGPDEAAWEMDQMDYDFHLFTEAGTGGDAVIYRSGPTGYRLARTRPAPAVAGSSEVPITLSPHPAPELTLAQARHRLEEAGWPFVFFVDERTGRGSVLYHRYDGHYGLITPAR